MPNRYTNKDRGLLVETSFVMKSMENLFSYDLLTTSSLPLTPSGRRESERRIQNAHDRNQVPGLNHPHLHGTKRFHHLPSPSGFPSGPTSSIPPHRNSRQRALRPSTGGSISAGHTACTSNHHQAQRVRRGPPPAFQRVFVAKRRGYNLAVSIRVRGRVGRAADDCRRVLTYVSKKKLCETRVEQFAMNQTNSES